jgi:hypothetical protein
MIGERRAAADEQLRRATKTGIAYANAIAFSALDRALKLTR